MKIETFLRRLRSGSLRRMQMYVGKVHKESHMSRPRIFMDMLWCALRYGIGYLEYQVYGFAHIHGERRKTFMTMNDNLNLVRQVNEKEYDIYFTDKARFNETFHEYLGRDWLDLRVSSPADMNAFLMRHDVAFAKTADGFGGIGVERIVTRDSPDGEALYETLKKRGQVIVEEAICQHPEMNRLCAASINTLRIVTLKIGGEVHLMYCLVRIGNGKTCVDNISSGGMYCPVSDDGVITKPGFCDKAGEYYERHPQTGTAFVGFQIPCYDDAVRMVRKAALVVPQIGYVGWDVAITPKGPLLVEGNTIPGYDMCQNYGHLNDKKEGVLPRFQKVLYGQK